MRERKNPPERDFEQFALRQGWQPTKRGWPDFLCFSPDGRVIAVEVKPRMRKIAGMKLLHRCQVDAMRQLEKAGIPCYVSDGENMERFNAAHHGDESRRYHPAR